MSLLSRRPRPRALSAALLALLLGCVNDESSARADAARALVRSAIPERFADMLRARYAARRACIDRHFPTTVLVTPRDTSARTREEHERYMRPFELLRDAGLVTLEEVRPGDRDRLPYTAAQVDSGHVARYVLSERGRLDAEPDTAGSGPGERLCYARLRLVVIDTVVTSGPSPAWSLDRGVTFGGAYAYVLHTVVFDSVAPWTPELARRDSLQDVAPRLEQLEGPQRRWARFGVVDGAWVLADDRTQGPEGAERIETRLARRSPSRSATDPARSTAVHASADSGAYAAADPEVDTAVAAAAAAAADSMAITAARYPRAFARDGKPLWRASGLVTSAREAHWARTVMAALPALFVLWWVALSLRALTVDTRRRAPVIVLAGVIGSLGWAVLGPLMVSWGMVGLDDRCGEGPALLASLVTAYLGAAVMAWSIADPRRESSGFRSRPAPVMIGTEQPTAPTIPEHLRPALLALCHFTLAGVALGLLVIGVAYGYFMDAVHPGVPERLAYVLAGLGVAAGVAGAARARG